MVVVHSNMHKVIHKTGDFTWLTYLRQSYPL